MDWGPKGSLNTGVAWQSSARDVRCWVKSRNERNQCHLLVRKGTLMGLAGTNSRTVGTTSRSKRTYGKGVESHTMVGTEGGQPARGSRSQNTDRSPDYSLQLDYMKSESLVIAGQHTAVNTFPGLVHTARHTMGVSCSRSR